MTPRPPVVVLAGVRWDFLWQRHQALATMFARNGYPTVFVETTGLSNPRPRSVAKVVGRVRGVAARVGTSQTPHVYSPKVLPPTWSVFRKINAATLVPEMVRDVISLVGENPAVVAYPPTRTTLDALSLLKPCRILYDCSDDYAYFRGIPADIRETEAELLDAADVVSCTSQTLLRRILHKRSDAFFSGPAVDTETFTGNPAPLKRPVRRVGYFGHLGEDRLKTEVFRGIAASGFDVRIFGEMSRRAGRLLEHPRIEYSGHIPHCALPEAISRVDALIAPYREDVGVTRGIFPAKTYEMLATGKPVVSSRLPSVVADTEVSRCLYFAGSVEEFVAVLGSLPGMESEAEVRERLAVARKNSWQSRFREIENRLFPGAG